MQPEPTADPETELIQEANAADVSTEPVATDAPAGEEGESASPTTGETEAIISEAATTTQGEFHICAFKAIMKHGAFLCFSFFVR